MNNTRITRQSVVRDGNRYCAMNKPNYDEKIEAARAWMEDRKIHQLGTEHLKQQRRIVSDDIEIENKYAPVA
jgi:hypothetical protein